MIQLSSKTETFPIAGVFRIARGARTQVTVVIAEAELAGARGRGECVPYTRYGETLDGVREQIARAAAAIAGCTDEAAARGLLVALLLAGAARNALDCALWDLEAKRKGVAVWQLAGLPAPPQPLVTAFTLSVDTPEAMGHAAARAAHRPLLKLKLTGDGDLERVAAVRRSAPGEPADRGCQ
jgi:L-alanine-DL-glutamate epimerase-like enolase superfamily enzyme